MVAICKKEIIELGEAAKKIFIGNAVLPVAIEGNIYLNNAVPSSHDPNSKIYESKGIKVDINLAQKKVQVQVNKARFCFGSPLLY